MNAYLNWNNDVEGKCDILINLDGIDNPVLHDRKIPDSNAIILNIGGSAVSGLSLGETEVTFTARFDKQAVFCAIPYRSIIYVFGPDRVTHALAYLTTDERGNAVLHQPPMRTTAPIPDPPDDTNDNVVPLRPKRSLTVVK